MGLFQKCEKTELERIGTSLVSSDFLPADDSALLIFCLVVVVVSSIKEN